MIALLQQKDVNNNRITRADGWLLSAVLLLALFARPAAAQTDGLHVTGGLGLPELINVGMHYQGGLVGTGASVGGIVLGENSAFSVTGNLSYHFSGYDEFSNPKPWYLKASGVYLRDEGEDLIHKYVYASARIGRYFVLSPRFTLKMDAGVMVQLRREEIRKESYDPLFDGLDVNLPVLPSIGVRIFYDL